MPTWLVRRSPWVVLVVALLATSLLAVLSDTPTAHTLENGTGGAFRPLTPARILNSTTGTGGYTTPWPNYGERTVQVLGRGGVPTSGVSAVVLDVATLSSTATSSSGALYAYPSDGVRPDVSFLRFGANQWNESNTVIVQPGADGKVALFNLVGSTNLNIDVQGYFTTESESSTSGGFHPLNARLVNSGAGVGVWGPTISGGSTYKVQAAGDLGIPTNATSIFANIRINGASAPGKLRVMASDAPTVTAVSMEFIEGEFNDMGLSVKLGADGKIKIAIAESAVTARIIIDVEGYFTASNGTGGGFTPLHNNRVFDTRGLTPLGPGETRIIPIRGKGSVPNDDTLNAVTLTVHTRNWSHEGNVVLYNSDVPEPVPSTVAYSGTEELIGASTTAIVQVSDAGTIKIKNRNSAGTVDVVLAVQGWFSKNVDHTTLDVSGPIAFGGTVSGVTSLAGAQIVVAIKPNEETLSELAVGESSMSLLVPRENVRTAGNRYAVAIEPTSIPTGNVDDGGLVAFEIYIHDPSTGLWGVNQASVRIGASSATQTSPPPAWVSIAVPRRTMVSTDEGFTAEQTLPPDPEGESQPIDETQDEIEASEPDAPPAAIQARFAPNPGDATEIDVPAVADIEAGPFAGTCDSTCASGEGKQLAGINAREVWAADEVDARGGMFSKKLLSTSIRNSTIGTTYPVGGDKAWMAFTSSAETTLGIAVNTGNGYYAKAGATRTIGSNLSMTSSRESYNRSYRTKVKYGNFLYCMGAFNCWKKWEPLYESGWGSAPRLYTSTPTWNTCGPVWAGTWERGDYSGEDYSFDAGVKFKSLIGIDLSTRRAYSSSSTVAYHLSQNKGLCGKGGKEPAIASKIRETHWSQ